MGLILASVGKLKSYLNKGCRLSPRELSDNNSSGRQRVNVLSANQRIQHKNRNKKFYNSFLDEDDEAFVTSNKLTNGVHKPKANGTENGAATSSSNDEYDK